jgi:hypothetical protein
MKVIIYDEGNMIRSAIWKENKYMGMLIVNTHEKRITPESYTSSMYEFELVYKFGKHGSYVKVMTENKKDVDALNRINVYQHDKDQYIVFFIKDYLFKFKNSE